MSSRGLSLAGAMKRSNLGMKFNAAGSRETVEQQIKFRFSEGDRKMGEVKTLLEAPTMREFGFLAGVKVLFESIIRSTTLYSSGAWVNMTKAMYEAVDREDKRQLYTLLKINSKTRYYNVLWELDLLPYSFAVMREKVSLVSHMCNAKVSQAGRVAIAESQREWKPGLVSEARRICQRLGLPDPARTYLSSDCIAEAVWKGARREMFQSIAADKHRLNMLAYKSKPKYIYNENLSNLEQKLIFSWRLGILQFKTRYKRLFNNQKCILRPCEGEDSMEHYLHFCEYLDIERPTNEKNMGEMRRFLMEFHALRTEMGIPMVYL